MPAVVKIRRLRLRSSTALCAFAFFAVASSFAVAPAVPLAQGNGVCAHPIELAAVGPACPRPDGLYDIVTRDGAIFTTHGPDPVPAPYVSRYDHVPGQKKPDCVSDPRTQPHGRVIYAYASDRPDRYPRMLWNIRAMVNVVNGFLSSEAEQFHRRIAYRMLCGGGVLSVARAKLATAEHSTGFSSIVSDLRAQGFTDPLEKYWIFYDGPPRGGAAGVGTFEQDSKPVSSNASNFGSSYAVTFGLDLLKGGWFVMMHEGGHNLGNVQIDAPNSSLFGHCNDGQDIMCYQEPNPGAPTYHNDVCPTLHFDCNFNDYFNPVPKPSNYLYTHWNLGSPLNSWVGGCTYQSGTMTAGLQGQSVDGVSSKYIGIPKACSGARFALSGFSLDAIAAVHAVPAGPYDLVRPYVVMQQAASRAPQDFNVCFYKGHARTTCSTVSGTDTGIIPRGTTSALITYNEGARGTWIFNAI